MFSDVWHLLVLTHKFFGSRVRFLSCCFCLCDIHNSSFWDPSDTFHHAGFHQQNRKIHKCLSDVNESMQFGHLTEYNFLSLTRATLCCRPLKNTHRDFVTHIFIAKSSYNILMSPHTSKAQNIAIQPHHELQIPHWRCPTSLPSPSVIFSYCSPTALSARSTQSPPLRSILIFTAIFKIL